MAKRKLRRRVVALVALWVFVVGAATIGSGCYGHNCDGTYETFGQVPGQGVTIDKNTWESNEISERWLDFPRLRTWTLFMQGFEGRTPQVVIPYVSAQESPLVGGNFTIGAGNIAQIYSAENGHLVVQNGTCADYYLRVVVIMGEQDASADADASDAADGGDAGTDAPTD